MRVLRFIVDGTTIRQDPTCDFSGLFPGREEQMQAEFVFSPDWKSRTKVAAFWSILDKEFPPQVINDDGNCIIPIEALNKVVYKVQVIGRYKNTRIKTDCVTVYQSGNR